MKFLNRVRSRINRRRSSLALTLEPLEGRRLMATLATVNNYAGVPSVFTLGSDGTVFVNQQRATGDPNHPYASQGLQPLPGLTNVSSIAAIQSYQGTLEVLATTGSQSQIYANIESLTGNPLKPQAWSGWFSLGSFQARSIVAAQGQNDNAVFAIGADSNVYQDIEGGQNFAKFTPIPGLSATSIAAASNPQSDSFQVDALTGPRSDIYQVSTFIPYTYPGTAENPPVVIKPNLTWTPVSTSFVAGSISVSPDPSNTSYTPGYSILATGGDGRVYRGEEASFAPNTTPLVSFQQVPSGLNIPIPLVSVTATLSAGIRYQNLFALNASGFVYENQALPPIAPSSNYTYTGWVPLAGLSGTSIAATATPGGGAEVVVRSSNGVTNFEQVAFHPAYGANNQPNLNVFTSPTRLDIACHPLAATTGPNGKPFVVTIGGDGTVYYAQDVSTTSSATTTDTYSGFTALPGITASSVSAATELDGVAVFATVNGLTFLNQDRPTGNGATPFAWTGWVGIGNTAEAMAVVNSGGSSTAPTLLQIPFNDQGPIEVFQFAPGSTPGAAYTVASGVTALSGLTAASMSAKTTTDGIEVVALTGAESYPYVNLYAPDPANPGQRKWSGWHVFNNVVMSQVQATTGVGGIPAITGIDSLGQQVFSENLPVAGTNSPAWSNFQVIPGTSPTTPRSDGSTFQGLASVTYKNNLGGAYFDVFAPTTNAVSGFGFTGSPQQFTGNPTIATIQASTLATTPDFADPSLFTGGDNGRIYVNQGVLSSDPKNPYTYLGWVALAALPS